MQACPSAPRKGFALLITITLLAFLVLLLVSLASLTRVETQVASNNQQLGQARQNALMALNIALGELQKYTGPDQRTTARSDMNAALVPASASSPVTFSGRWVGAYGNGAEADYSMVPTDITKSVKDGTPDAKGSQAKLLNWLVSGNEGTAFDSSAHVGIKGNITTPPAVFQFTPGGTVAGLSASSTALTDTITILDKDNATKPARLLVGPNTAGDSVADYVVAPLREINAVTPGLGASAVAIGRYAWWVGDENTKARVNLPMADATKAANAFASSQRPAVELMDALNPSAGTTLTTAAMLDATGSDNRYNPADPSLAKLMATDQLPMLSPSAEAELRRVAKYRYHDISIRSKSVLSDTYAGGLKKDLSAILADITPASHASPRADNDFLFKPEAGSTNHLGVPTWGQLRSFAQTTATAAGLLPRPPTLSAAADPAAYPNAPVPTSVGINPVMTYASFGFRCIAPDGDAVGKKISLAMAPIVVLWNPYTVPIRGTDDAGNPVRYEVGVRKNAKDKIELQGRPMPAVLPEATPYAWGSGNRLVSGSLGADVPNQYYRFTIESPPGGIPAGQSLVFTLGQTGDDYAAGANILTNGMNDNFFVILPAFNYTITPALGAGAYYRVAVNGSPRTISSVAIPQTAWGVGADGHWGGDGGDGAAHEVYFGDYNPTGVNVPQSSYPWSSTYGSRRVYQHFSAIGPPLPDAPPYGTNYAKTGYATSSGASGLVQPEGPLATELTTVGPAFRMVVRTLFSNLPNSGTSIGDTSRERWILQNNARAFIMARKANNTLVSGRASSTDWPYDLMSPDDIHASSGTGVDKPLNDTVLYEFRPADRPLLSIGQMQHANLGWLVSSPSYAIGNSNSSGSNHASGVQADVSGGKLNNLLPERLVKLAALDPSLDPGKKITAAYDQSWLLNRALWDGYFVSTVPHAGTGKTTTPADTNSTDIPDPLPDPLLSRYNVSDDAQLRDADIVASKLLLNGGFNINSTSEQAWRALLGGNNRLGYDATGANTGGPAWSKVVFSRFSKPTTNSTASAWLGYKQLTEIQTARLAKNIVAEIRRRGPSVSLADFINRRLFTSNATLQPEDARLKGPIQAAIDAVTTGAEAINSIDVGSPLNVLAGTGASSYKVLDAYGKVTLDPYTAGSSTPAAPTPPYGTSGAGSPQFLTQADVLSTIGNQLSARSDTFVIRTYGEVLDPVNSTSTAPVVLGRAWCEATVQRLPEFVDDSMPAQTDLRTAPNSTAKTINQNFGRKYKIISFRWLTSGDI
jgi:type II secretory pathway pseudopilin PulG